MLEVFLVWIHRLTFVGGCLFFGYCSLLVLDLEHVVTMDSLVGSAADCEWVTQRNGIGLREMIARTSRKKLEAGYLTKG